MHTSYICGWMSPSGEYFQCSAYQHENIAFELAETLYQDNGGSLCLEEGGWIRIEQSGRLLYVKPPTMQQATALEGMLDQVPHVQSMMFWLSVGDVIAKALEFNEETE
jgi:hypothetical protein